MIILLFNFLFLGFLKNYQGSRIITWDIRCTLKCNRLPRPSWNCQTFHFENCCLSQKFLVSFLNSVIVCTPSKWFFRNVDLLEVKKIDVISFPQVFCKHFYIRTQSKNIACNADIWKNTKILFFKKNEIY